MASSTGRSPLQAAERLTTYFHRRLRRTARKTAIDKASDESYQPRSDAADRSCQLSPDDSALALSKNFTAADPVRASDVATLLLLVQGIARVNLSVETLLSVLRLEQPIIVIDSPVAGFEEILLGLLETGVVLPRIVGLADGYGLGRRRFPLPYKVRSKDPLHWHVIRFAGSDYGNTDEERQAGYAAQTTLPIIAVSESLDYLPQSLLPAAHLHLDCGPLTPEVVEETVGAVLGELPSVALSPEHCALLSLGNLAMAIRRGHPPDRAIEILREYAETAASQVSGAMAEEYGQLVAELVDIREAGE